jgi:hypothetical protein
MIRHARGDDLPVLRELERAAGVPFREPLGHGMIVFISENPGSASLLKRTQARNGRGFIIRDGIHASWWPLLMATPQGSLRDCHDGTAVSPVIPFLHADDSAPLR